MVRLGEYITLKTGKLDVNASSEDGQYPFFTCATKIYRIDNWEYDCECVLIAGNGNLNVKYYEGKFNAYQRTYILESKDKRKLDVRYLFHFMNKYIETLREGSIGGVIKYIKKGDIEEADIPLGSIDEQRRIADILDKADEIKQDTATIVSLRNEIITSVFNKLFGDTYNNKNFDTKKLSELIDKNRGISYGVVQRGQNIEDGIPLIRIRDIINNNFDANSLVRTKKENSDKYKRTILKGGELLISIRGTVGKLAIVPEHAKGWNVTREVAVIPFATEINRTYLLCFLKSQGVQTKILGDVKGVAQSGINLTDLRELDVLIPPQELAEKFAIIVESVKSIPGTHELAKNNQLSITQELLT